MSRVINVNVGILGHVDSGKTSLAKALSQMASTACFDKSPESQERGITLDLGFSAFVADSPMWMKESGFDTVQFTLVDCPGHASLIKTIIGGAQIIDLMMLVIDVTKGIQTQTAECIVIGEMLARRLVVVLNKIDQITSEEQLLKTKKRLRAIFAQTRWPRCDMVEVAANPGGGGAGEGPIGLAELTRCLVDMVPFHVVEPVASDRNPEEFLMFVDHCFPIKGQGTVLTGTVLRGCLEVNQNIELPALKEKRKVKSMQVFKRPVERAARGDRVGICVTNLPSENIERAMVCSPSSHVTVTVTNVVAVVQRVRFYKGKLATGSKMHITVGHETVLATVRYFEGPREDGMLTTTFTLGTQMEYTYLEELPEESAVSYVDPKSIAERPAYEPSATVCPARQYYAVMHFEQSLRIPTEGATLIGARLDSDTQGTACRLTLEGHVVHVLRDDEDFRNIYAARWKAKALAVDRVLDDTTCLARGGGGAKGAEADCSRFVGLRCHFQPEGWHPLPQRVAVPVSSPAFEGFVEGTFGKTGKVKIRFRDPVFKKGEDGSLSYPGYSLVLHVKKNQFALNKQLMQW